MDTPKPSDDLLNSGGYTARNWHAIKTKIKKKIALRVVCMVDLSRGAMLDHSEFTAR